MQPRVFAVRFLTLFRVNGYLRVDVIQTRPLALIATDFIIGLRTWTKCLLFSLLRFHAGSVRSNLFRYDNNRCWRKTVDKYLFVFFFFVFTHCAFVCQTFSRQLSDKLNNVFVDCKSRQECTY